MLERARRAGVMVIHVRNNGGEGDPDAPGSAGWELVHEAAGHEAVIDKRTPDAFDSTGLGGLLRRSGRLSSPACRVSTACARHRSPPWDEASPWCWHGEPTRPTAAGSAPRRR
jgi:hypothetical protein